MEKELKQLIKDKEIQLSKLKTHADKSSVCSDLYNKIVLEKAILNKKLKDCRRNVFAEFLRNLIPGKKTLICDYFKTK